MALILCPHCAAKISDRANACPKCGRKLGIHPVDQPVAEQPIAPIMPPAAEVAATPPTPEPSQPAKSPANVKQAEEIPALKPRRPILSEGGTSQPPSKPTPQPEIPTESSHNGKLLAYLFVGVIIVIVLIYIFTRFSAERHAISPSETSVSTGSASAEKTSDANALEAEATVYTFADNTWLRSSMKAGVDYNKLNLLTAGTTLTVLGIYDDWTRVREPKSGNVGYISTDFIMSANLFSQLTSRTTVSQRAALTMAKYRRAVAFHLFNNENAHYGGVLSEQNYTDNTSAILLTFTYPNEPNEAVLFGFDDNKEIWSVHLTKSGVSNPYIQYDGYEYSIGSN